ncbi:MAG: hypothetical protein LJF04_04545 [Gemmatimonadetes bacterium]|nr:hypothetical protein [Gemmatimonadota bacterium]
MAPIRVDASHFSPDTRAFLEALAAKAVRYLIVGGEAVNDIDGVTLDEAWPGRGDAVIRTEKVDVDLAFIGLEALVKNKRASGRPFLLRVPRPDKREVEGSIGYRDRRRTTVTSRD